jgi:hypothetical protein
MQALTQRSPWWPPVITALLGAWVLVAGVYAGLQPALGEDLWWLLAAGRYIMQHHTIPARDVFSYTADGAPWVNQEWLTQVLYYGLYRWVGGDGLALFKIGLVASLFGLVGWVSARRAESTLLGACATVGAASFIGSFLDLRAQLFTFVGTIVLIALLDAYRRGARPRLLLAIPCVLLLWVNLHYGFIFGLGLLALYAAGETLKAVLSLPENPMALARVRWLWVVLGLAFLASLGNPEGVRALAFPFRIIGEGDAWRQIIEWRPPRLVKEGALAPFGYWLVVQAMMAFAALWAARLRLDVTDLALAAVTLEMALGARRFIPLFVVVSTPLLARNAALVVRRLFGPAATALQSRVGAVLAATVAGVGLVVATRATVAQARTTSVGGLFAGLTYASQYPADAVAFLERNAVPGRLYNFYSWGGYLLYWMPERKVFMDGRAHAVYPTSLFLENVRVEGATPGWEAVLDQHGVDLVLVLAGYNTAVRLRALSGWQRIYDDGYAAIFVRRTAASEPLLAHWRAHELWYPETAGAQLSAAEAYRDSEGDEGALREFVGTIRRFGSLGVGEALRRQRFESAVARATGAQDASRTAALYEKALRSWAGRGGAPARGAD